MSVYDCVLFAASASHLPFIIVAGLFLLTAAVVIIVNIQPDKRRRNTQRDCVIPKKPVRARGQCRRAERAIIRRLKERDGDFDPEQLKQSVLQACQRVYEAIERQDVQAARPYVTEEMYQRLVQAEQTDPAHHAAVSGEAHISGMVFSEYRMQGDDERLSFLLLTDFVSIGGVQAQLQKDPPKEEAVQGLRPQLFKLGIHRTNCSPASGSELQCPFCGAAAAQGQKNCATCGRALSAPNAWLLNDFQRWAGDIQDFLSD